ncbi:MAG: hypothetical protein GX446_17020 [Chthonomonadales bacterium]|nr:hypothetical protein [Chthonomonadales bacterium]
MKTQVHPAVAVVIVVIVIAVIGALGYRLFASKQVDTSQSMSPELRAKILKAYGAGQQRPASRP